MSKKMFVVLYGLLFISLSCFSQNDYAVREVKNGLYIPWEMVYAPDGAIWFTQRHGAISRLDPVTGQMKQLHFEQEVVAQNEGGMLGLAMHPDFPNTAEVFCVYNYNSGSGYKEKVAVYNYIATTDTLQYKATIVDNLEASGIHNGSRLLIDNNKLFVTTGDAANQSLPQDLNSLNGKILRYNLDGSIPADNPIAGSAIWTWGHRNPQGLSMMGNKLVSSEHGPNTDDEINIIDKGRNYGWPNVHGYCNTSSEITFCNDSNVYEPAIAWTPTLAVSGIDYYTHSLFPQWQNKMLMTTLKDQTLYVLTFNAGQDSVISVVDIPEVNFGRLRDVMAAPDGKIYLSTSNSSSVNNKTDKIYEIYDPTPTSVENVNLRTEDWMVSPVPAVSTVTLSHHSGKATADIDLTDINGRILASKKINGGNMVFDVSEYPGGVYIIRVKTQGKNPQVLKVQKL